MRPIRFGVRVAAAGAILLSAFSALATWLIYSGRWPELRPGVLRDVDLWAGLVFLLLLLGWLLLRREGSKQ